MTGLPIIGAFAGWLADRYTKESGFGLFGNVIADIFGAFVGWVRFGFQACGPPDSSG
jgi:uncharacterized membrane protein YeaQ/YmgE (transglycosylase-associated protein family)